MWTSAQGWQLQNYQGGRLLKVAWTVKSIMYFYFTPELDQLLWKQNYSDYTPVIFEAFFYSFELFLPDICMNRFNSTSLDGWSIEWLKRTRLPRCQMIWLLPHPLPVSNLSLFLGFLCVTCQAWWQERVEPNHTVWCKCTGNCKVTLYTRFWALLNGNCNCKIF